MDKKLSKEYLDQLIVEYNGTQLHLLKYVDDGEFYAESDCQFSDRNQELRDALLNRLLETEAKNGCLVRDLIIQNSRRLDDYWDEVEGYQLLAEKLLRDTGVNHLSALLKGISANFDSWEGKYSVLVDSDLLVGYLDVLIAEYDEKQIHLIEYHFDEGYYAETSGANLDRNEELRYALLMRLLETDAKNEYLVRDLFLEIAGWSGQKHGIIRGHERLGAKLLKDTGTKYLISFTEGISASFDAWRNCFAMNIDEDLRIECLKCCKDFLHHPNTSEELRYMTENSIKLFQALRKPALNRSLVLEKYSQARDILPASGEIVSGQFDSDCIVVYQAFNDSIADYALQNQSFGGPHYRFQRMSWIKSNFLWMMYRSGWASKLNQERILAISLGLSDFKEFIGQGVHSSYIPELYATRELWMKQLAASEIRLQWDPDHDPYGEKLERRALQIGLKGETLKRFNERIVRIEDITDFVREQKVFVDSQQLDQLLIPKERVVIYEK
jgi:hypothetical protein